MFDAVAIIEAMAVAALTAAAVTVLCGWPRRSTLKDLGGPIGVAAGFYFGCWLSHVKFHRSIADEQDRLLLIVLPLAVLVEVFAAIVRGRWWAAWPLRLVIAAAVARVLLHNSVFITDFEDLPRLWDEMLTWKILGALAATLAAVWLALNALARRTAGHAPLFALALACAGAGVAVMLSGSATGGLLGLPLAAALAGHTAASTIGRHPANPAGAIGVGIVGLFSILVAGRFFAELSTANAVLLFMAPALCWLTALPVRLQGIARVAVAAVPVAAVLLGLGLKFVKDNQKQLKSPTESQSNTVDITPDDYAGYGK